MDQCANVSICQPVCTHGATDWHISRMRLFIVLSRFSHRRLLFCVERVGYRQKSLYRSVRNETESHGTTSFQQRATMFNSVQINFFDYGPSY